MQSAELDKITFRGALLQACNDMGKETWKRFCFLYDVPERVRERGRSGVLDHLVITGAVSSDRPEEFAERLRTSLSHHDLAQKFLEALAGAEATRVETRLKSNRRSHSPDRRHGRHFAPSEIVFSAEVSPSTSNEKPEEEDEDAPTGTEGAGIVQRLSPVSAAAALRLCEEDDGRDVIWFRNRHDSGVSMYSNRSSGYISWRSSSVTSRDSLVSLQSEVAAGDEVDPQCGKQDHLHTVLEQPREQPRPPLDRITSSSSSSYSSSTSEEDFLSCHSSIESLPTSGSLPRYKSVAGALRGDVDSLSLQTKSHREQCLEVIDSPTFSNVKKTFTICMWLKLKDIIRDIDKKHTQRVYHNSKLQSDKEHRMDFELRFCPTSHKGHAALYVDVISHSEKEMTRIPPLDISVSVYGQLASDKCACDSENDCLASAQYGLKDGCISRGQYCNTAPFPKLIDHASLHRVKGDTVTIQVVVEYTPPLHH